MTRLLRIFLSVAFGIGLLAACGPAPVSPGTVRVGITALPPSLGNPHRGTNMPTIVTWAALFDCLTFVDLQGEVQPWLALQWTAESERVWVFTLRPGVRFSNGEMFDAEAAAATLNYLTSPEAARDSVAQEVRNVAGARARDALTLEITTKSPDLFLPRTLATVRIVAPKAWKEFGPDGFARAPVGTGPFKLERWLGNKAILIANETSWRAPKTKRLELLVIPDDAARLQALLAGQIDVALGLDPRDRRLIEGVGGRLITRPGPNIMVLSFVTVKPGPLQDVRVRQALNYAVDKQIIVDVLFDGENSVASQPAPPHAFGFDPSLAPYPYDPDKARALLAEAGYPNGFAFNAEAVTTGGDAAMFAQVASDLAKVGVKMTMQAIPAAQLIRYIQQGDFKGEAFGMDYGTAPSLDALRPLRLHSCQWRVPWNCDSAIMPKLEAAQTSFNLEERQRLTREVMAYWRDTAPALYLFNIVGFTGLGPRIGDYDTANNLIRYDLITLKEARP